MGKKMTFDELLARKEQREADRMRIGEITVPGTDQVLEVRTPGDKAVMSIYGSLMGAESPEDALAASRKAIYDCCPALQDGKLHAALECQAEPIRVVDRLFNVAEIDAMGGDVLRFLHLIPEKSKAAEENPGEETVKN